ncbi:4'-phosphopantetheinyl transferase family protein [Oceanisphaera pacifica]|uniref:4'-phosphopantetheinyl transferase superfamily protein n=1 Tax=Oceanisphaera pacifica TaxID=2818389 RepID=A0ABS3NE77_9GAMM|nr:4'-phosphopantetheinyl transferase superfamily protein [Oceanisphaera pacifica]MBO1518888.1 4'-phosphopantetheinyl transferase superfamily protein [Oceanisphaera pacifica]
MSKQPVTATQILICDADHLILPPHAKHLLSQPEQARLNKMQSPQQAKLFLLGRYLLRQLLAPALQQAPEHIAISLDEKGKPQLTEASWHFNISHSGNLLALAFGNQGPLGIDVESRTLSEKQIHRLAKRYFAPNEQVWLEQAQTQARFLQLWTIKEAVLKAHGGGIANNLSAVQWQPFEPIAHFDKAQYQLHLYQAQHTRVTLALQDAALLHNDNIHRLNVADLPFALEISGPQPNLSYSV